MPGPRTLFWTHYLVQVISLQPHVFRTTHDMQKQKVAKQVEDFLVLPVHLPVQPSFPTEATHYLYIRANAPRVPNEDTPRELFAVNVPIDATDVHFRSLFADQLGGPRVEAVHFEDARTGNGIKAPISHSESHRGKKRKRGAGSENGGDQVEDLGLLPETWDRQLHRCGGTAVLRFVDRTSAELALKETKKAIKRGAEITWGAGMGDRLPLLGSARYLAHHKLRYPDPATLQQSVDEFMSAFAEQEAELARLRAKQRSVPDEDGFITVTRGGRNGTAREEETKAKEEELKRREKDRVKDDFYRFQVREKKKEQAKDLAKGFEEDRRRLAEMRKRKGRLRPE